MKMKIIRFYFFLFILGNLSFSEEFDYTNKIVEQRISVINGIDKMNFENGDQGISADVVAADEVLRQISNLKIKNQIYVLNLVFPDIDYINEYIEEVAPKVKNINIYLFDVPNNYKYMKNRDYITYELKKIDKKVGKFENIKVFKIHIPNNEITDVFLESLFIKVGDSKYFQKYIKGVK